MPRKQNPAALVMPRVLRHSETQQHAVQTLSDQELESVSGGFIINNTVGSSNMTECTPPGFSVSNDTKTMGVGNAAGAISSPVTKDPVGVDFTTGK